METKSSSELPLVVIESPYAGLVERNVQYLKRAIRHSLMLGEAPFASHMLYTQVLDDMVAEERNLGIKAGFAWGRAATKIAVYQDLGISPGMKAAITRAQKNGIPVEYRSIGEG